MLRQLDELEDSDDDICNEEWDDASSDHESMQASEDVLSFVGNGTKLKLSGTSCRHHQPPPPLLQLLLRCQSTYQGRWGCTVDMDNKTDPSGLLQLAGNRTDVGAYSAATACTTVS